MLQHPGHDWVVHRYVPLEPCLEAKLHGAEQASYQADSDLSAAVGLRVVGRGVLLGELVQIFAFDPRDLEHSSYQRL